jgi:hypothetical protein
MLQSFIKLEEGIAILFFLLKMVVDFVVKDLGFCCNKLITPLTRYKVLNSAYKIKKTPARATKEATNGDANNRHDHYEDYG